MRGETHTREIIKSREQKNKRNKLLNTTIKEQTERANKSKRKDR
jgi:hypothetical protein